MVVGYGIHKAEVVEYCRDNDLELKEYIYPSGDIVKDLITLSRQEDIESLVVYNSDDISSDTAEYFYYVQEFNRRGKDIICMNSDYDASLEELMREIVAYGGEIIHRRSAAVRVALKDSTSVVAKGRVPYGYKVHGNKTYVVPDEAACIQKCFALRDEGYSTREIAAELCNEGFLARNGKFITRSHVEYWLNRKKLYEGYLQINGEWVKGDFPSII